MKSLKIIFDLDGTLVDSSPGILNSLTKAFNEMGLSPIKPLSTAIVGPPLDETLLQLCPNLAQEKIKQLTGLFKAHYDSNGFKQSYPFPGVTEMIRILIDSGIPLHIATNKRQLPTSQILDVLGWSELFDKVFSPDSFSPALQSKAKILAKLIINANLKPKECLYVGDRLDDYKAAKEIGILFALAEWGFEGDGSEFPPDTIRLQAPDAGQLMSQFI